MRSMSGLILAALVVVASGSAVAQDRKACKYGANPLAWPFQWQLCGLNFLSNEQKAPNQSTTASSDASATVQPAQSARVAQEGPTPLLDRAMQLLVPNIAVPEPRTARAPSSSASPPTIAPTAGYVPPIPEYDRTRSTPATQVWEPKPTAPANRDLNESTR